MGCLTHQDVVPAVNQIETHPFHQQIATQQFLIENNIQLESWGPFAEGRNNLFGNPTLSSIGARHGKSIAQVVVRWLIQRAVVIIPKSVRRERIIENFGGFDFQLDSADMAAIAALDTGESLFFDHRDPRMVKSLSEAKRNT